MIDMRMPTCTQTYLCAHTLKHAHTHTHTHIQELADLKTFFWKVIPAAAPAPIPSVRKNTYLHMLVYTLLTLVHTNKHTYTHTNTHTCIEGYKYTFMKWIIAHILSTGPVCAFGKKAIHAKRAQRYIKIHMHKSNEHFLTFQI